MLIGLAVAHHLNVTAKLESTATVQGGIEAILFYLVAYGAMTVGAFAVLAYLSTPQRPIETEDDLAGLSSSHPGIALLMAVFLFSLIGIPLTAGFAGKLLLFSGAITADFRWLAVIGAVNAAIGAWYYLRILARMYLDVSVQPLVVLRNGSGLAALWACALVTLVLGFYPELLLRATTRAAAREPARAAASAPFQTARLP
jgi:NADH-quinone oxidoreductase subunit N